MSSKHQKRTRDIPTSVDKRGKLPTGVEGQNIPDEFSIPPVGIEDVDRALFEHFDKKIGMQVDASGQMTKVPTIFAGGERFAIVKKNKPIRDKNGMLILPIVAVRRTGIEQSIKGPIPGRGMGTDTGDLVIKRRLAKTDAKYQNLINAQQLDNQDNVSSDSNKLASTSPQGSKSGKTSSRRATYKSINNVTGELLNPDLGKNIFEIITMPFPHFYTALYEITFWSQYVQHMNQMIERFMACYDAQGKQFRLDTPKGYWFVAYVDENMNSDDNFSDYTGDERIIKTTFTIKVPAYIHASKNPGDPIPFRSFLSAPQISFGIYEGAVPDSTGAKNPVGSGELNKFILDDVELLDKRGDRVEDPRIQVEKVKDFVKDPFTGKESERFLRVINRNMRSGETVVSKRIATKIDDVNF